MGEDEIRLSQEKLYCWTKDKPGATITGATLGRLVLTDQFLIFLSKGKNDLGLRLAVGVFANASTKGLDESALSNKGSFKVPLDRCTITAAKKGMMSKYLLVKIRDDGGVDQSLSFMLKNGREFGRDIWEQTAGSGAG